MAELCGTILSGDIPVAEVRNGVVTVTAASCAYPQATAGYRVEIRTVATDIRYRAVERDWGKYVLTASVWPEDASPDRI